MVLHLNNRGDDGDYQHEDKQNNVLTKIAVKDDTIKCSDDDVEMVLVIQALHHWVAAESCAANYSFLVDCFVFHACKLCQP